MLVQILWIGHTAMESNSGIFNTFTLKRRENVSRVHSFTLQI